MPIQKGDVDIEIRENPTDSDEQVVMAHTDDRRRITWIPVNSLYAELEARQRWVRDQQEVSDAEAEYGDCRFCEAEDVRVGVTTQTICLDCASTAFGAIEQYAEEHPDELLGDALD